jgi:hypothetical protein
MWRNSTLLLQRSGSQKESDNDSVTHSSWQSRNSLSYSHSLSDFQSVLLSHRNNVEQESVSTSFHLAVTTDLKTWLLERQVGLWSRLEDLKWHRILLWEPRQRQGLLRAHLMELGVTDLNQLTEVGSLSNRILLQGLFLTEANWQLT